jgi:hypothetical protein
MRSPLPLKDFYRVADGLNGRTILDAYAIRWPRSKKYEAAHLILDKGSCRIQVDVDMDEVLIFLGKRAIGARAGTTSRTRLDRGCLAQVVGKKIGWSWTCYNSQGYRDVVMLSVTDVVPDLIFYAIASDLYINRVSLPVK